jgi:hypothetical protein
MQLEEHVRIIPPGEAQPACSAGEVLKGVFAGR